MRARLAEWLWDAGDTKAALAAYEEASRLVATEPHSAGKARVLGGYGTELMRQGQYSTSRVLCEKAIAVARAVGARVEEEARARNTLGCDLSGLGDSEAGAVVLRQALVLAEETGNFDEIHRAYNNLSVLLQQSGNCLSLGRHGRGVPSGSAARTAVLEAVGLFVWFAEGDT